MAGVEFAGPTLVLQIAVSVAIDVAAVGQALIREWSSRHAERVGCLFGVILAGFIGEAVRVVIEPVSERTVHVHAQAHRKVPGDERRL